MTAPFPSRRLLALLFALAAPLTSTSARAEVSFMRDVAPVLVKRCTACHGERKDAGDYRAHTFESLTRHAGSDDAPIVPGKPQESVLYQLITTDRVKERMPQKDDPLPPEQVETIRKWIAEGAKFDGGDKTASFKSLMGPRQHPAPPQAYRIPVPVMAVAFAPGGKELAVGGHNEITVWDPATGTLARRIPHLPQRIQSIAFATDGAQLLVAGGTPGDYGELSLADPAGAKPPKVIDTFDDILLATAFSRDGKLIAAGGADQGVRVYDRVTGKRLWSARLHSDWVTGVSFSADGRFLASASRDMTVKLYDANTGVLFTTYAGHNRQLGPFKGAAPVYDVAFATDAPLAFSAGGEKWIQIWNPEKAKEENGTAADLEERFAKQGHAKYIVHGFKREVYRLALRPAGVFAASGDGDVKLFDPTTLKEIRAYTGLTDWAFALDCDAASGRLAAGGADGRVRVWEVDTAKVLSDFFAAPGFVSPKR